MSESNFWHELRDSLPDGHYSRVESHMTSIGFPDVDYCVSGTEGNLELKYGDDKKLPNIRGSQVKWFRTRIKHGGYPLIFVKLLWDGKHGYIIYSGELIDELREAKSIAAWIRVADKNITQAVRWTGGLNTNDLRFVLVNPHLLYANRRHR